jgi:hypothetical protein
MFLGCQSSLTMVDNVFFLLLYLYWLTNFTNDDRHDSHIHILVKKFLYFIEFWETLKSTDATNSQPIYVDKNYLPNYNKEFVLTLRMILILKKDFLVRIHCSNTERYHIQKFIEVMRCEFRTNFSMRLSLVMGLIHLHIRKGRIRIPSKKKSYQTISLSDLFFQLVVIFFSNNSNLMFNITG